jgi:spore coat protein SA
LFVGKLRESKGVGLLLEAMHQVWPQCPQAVLVLAGGTEFGRGRTDRRTPFFQQLQARVAKAPGRVILTGFIAPADIWRVYLLGDLLVGPSQNQEGLGIVFLEAAASGLPIIATRMGGIPEVVQDGVNGLLLEEPGDARELAAKIRQLLRSPEDRRRLGQQGRDLVAEHFTWEKIARQQEEMYDQVGGTLNL